MNAQCFGSNTFLPGVAAGCLFLADSAHHTDQVFARPVLEDVKLARLCVECTFAQKMAGNRFIGSNFGVRSDDKTHR